MERPQPGDNVTLSDLGMTSHTFSRRDALRAGLGVAAGIGAAGATGLAAAPSAQAGLNKRATANAVWVGGDERNVAGSQLTGPTQTGQFSVPHTDLAIPVERADGSLIFICGDTYGTNVNPGNPADPANNWRSPVALTSNQTNSAGRAVINGAITDGSGRAKALVIQNHDPAVGGNNTELPTDAFRVGNTLYMHTAFGVYNNHVDYSAFYNSFDGGQTWNYLRRWDNPRDYGSAFQQKTYAVADDAYVYCMSTVFNRSAYSDLLLFRVLKSDLDKNDGDARASGFGQRFAYQGWGYANGRWAWGNLPTTIVENRTWGEICFRAMGGKYVLSWLQTNDARPDLVDLRAMVFPLPTSNLVTTTEQTMVYNSAANPSAAPVNSDGTGRHVQAAPYAPFIFPRSTFQNFNFVVSDWDPARGAREGYGPNAHNYCVSQWRTSLNPNIPGG